MSDSTAGKLRPGAMLLGSLRAPRRSWVQLLTAL
jgi:hypothetical protein